MNFSVTVDQMGRGDGLPTTSRPNAEIYNHAELRAELEALGCNFATRSDTEVLINVVARVGRGGSLSAARNVRICAVVALAGNCREGSS